MLLQGSICGYGLILWDGMTPEGRVRLLPAAPLSPAYDPWPAAGQGEGFGSW